MTENGVFYLFTLDRKTVRSAQNYSVILTVFTVGETCLNGAMVTKSRRKNKVQILRLKI